MEALPQTLKYVPMRSPTPPLGSSTEDLDEFRLEQELEKMEGNGEARKPHFLDYDSIPPPGLTDHCIAITPNHGLSKHPGEAFKVDKIYEKDGEISDFEYAATKERRMHRSEKLAMDKTPPNGEAIGGARRKKHFLDENPIPPEYDYNREHRSLDRTYDRSPKDFENIRYERKHSLDRGRSRKAKEPSYAMSRFLETTDDSQSVLRGTWPGDKPESLGSFNSMRCDETPQLGKKVEIITSLLSMLGCGNNQTEMSAKFLELSKSPETCASLRQSRCIPLLVQMIHMDTDEVTKKNATTALHNVVNCHPDDKAGRREAKVLRHIEQIMEYCESLRSILGNGEAIADDSDRHPLQEMSSLMKVSFDEDHRHAMCSLGALQAIASVVHYDHAVHGTHSKDPKCISLRRFAGMALTNLTFGDGNNKALLCANKDFMKALVAQIDTSGDDLLAVTANVLRNLSWRADKTMKSVLNEIGTVTALTKAAMKNKNENTLRAILSALWNLSAHCSTNKTEFCMVDGALSFLVEMLTFEAPSKTSSIIENAGGILRNVSSHIAVNEDFRRTLRLKNCLGILLEQLKSESLTVVSNSCGTLWNLSARCPEDQKFLWDNGAVPMLRSLIHSKHKMISNGSKAALKNLLNFKPGEMSHNHLDPVAKMMNLRQLPSLNMRKQRALQQELDQNLAETCDNLDITTPPKEEKNIVDFIQSNSGYQSQRFVNNTVAPYMVSSKSSDSSRVDEAHNQQRSTSEVRALQTATENPASSGVPEHSSPPKVPVPTPRGAQVNPKDTPTSSKYQETDLDQITDFSLLYAENHNESSDHDETKDKSRHENENNPTLDDTVQCYETEGTPCNISSAASVTDLRITKPTHDIVNKTIKSGHMTVENSGINTPEKPIKYCEEGTPGYFSIHDSFSSLEEEPAAMLSLSLNPTNLIEPSGIVHTDGELTIQHLNGVDDVHDAHGEAGLAGCETDFIPTTPGGTSSKAVTFNDFLETPLMFSRHSSMASISSIEPNMMADDRSSVVSEIRYVPILANDLFNRDVNVSGSAFI